MYFTLLSGVALASGVTPIEKVIDLIRNLKNEVEMEGKDEASAYDKFACFCKDTTDKKVGSIKKQHDVISDSSADIADKTQTKAVKTTELGERKQKQEKLSADLDSTVQRCAKEKAEYEAEAADLSKAIQGLKDAIKAMKTSKPASFLAVRQSLSKTLEMAGIMDMALSPRHHAVVSLLQRASVDPSDPEFKFHSDDIIDVCEELLVDYKAEKDDLDTEFGKSSKACADMKKSLKKQMRANKEAMEQLVKDIAKLGEEIAQHRTDLIEAESQLKDDEQYLNDMTARCEARANDYDQRSAMRGGELTALTGALEVLEQKVKGRADDVNVRAAFVQKAQTPTNVHAAEPVVAKTIVTSVSLLQEVSESSESLSQEARRSRALAMLKQEGQRLGSMVLQSFSVRASADPFKKVKGLIQKLIERLLTESQNEATKKGFCDTELGKARSERDSRWQEANDLSADLAKLEAKEDALVAELKQLKGDLKDEKLALKETTEEREDEKKVNMETLKTAKEGLEAVNEAIMILRTFYKQAAKASFVQASPVDEDTSGPGFSGNYKGSQAKSNAIFGLLETIASDFDRTLRKTDEAENVAHRDYVDFSQTAKSSIAGKEKKTELDDQDLKETRTNIKTKTDDMQTAVDLLDKALQELEELKPTCIDTGMSYAERVKKREEEIKALEKALTILAPPSL
jgi:hypothetical protein